MGVGFIFTASAVFTTVVFYLYVAVVNQDNGVNKINEIIEFNQECQKDNVRHLKRDYVKFFLPRESRRPTKILYFDQIPALKRRKKNKSKFVDGLDFCISVCQAKNKFVLITNVISLKGHQATLEYYERIPTWDEMEARFIEVLNTLQMNLNNPNVKTLIVLVESYDMAKILSGLALDNSHKLFIHNVEKELSMVEAMEYGTRCFPKETIVIANQDVSLGDGWKNLDYQYLRENKVMYALTRHDSKINPGCIGNTKLGICQGLYRNSHDAFVFNVKEPVPVEYLNVLRDQPYNVRGVENIIIWVFQKKLHYKVTNPCSLLKIHHEHCVPIRNSKGLRTQAGNDSIWGSAEFTNSFY